MSIEFVLPGDIVGKIPDTPGENTRLDEDGFIYATIAGTVQKIYKHESKDIFISVLPSLSYLRRLYPGALVIGTVLSVSRVESIVSISHIDGYPLPKFISLPPNAPLGRIKPHSISEDTDELKLHQVLYPGDKVRAYVLSLGDRRGALLSIEPKECGVLSSIDIDRELLVVPIDETTGDRSQENVIVGKSGKIFKRKTASNILHIHVK
ncbi:Exosome complex component Csl4 like protein [Aduncisulcus paluster]|uniref:Exosome complex component Csl4 like protein n=1 Tax=Aduncisulcus paluster TaxID=2918883 RepID=A0ABQ5KJU0_9EUKA|nr:Exosome complex component Csl4 like protein [Aduncisulcus paluster]|eukprot:gnl/Carplike_NY0171/4641_a6304_308.p1 GENE.gnl/Carplike_NY0171/4641_a6304_308~~gnl/Carplike_NY0171/4641_a6304_308.p1  ORF type:complete len:208 (-),score=19.48 gnl/Carplike_NY0171/4641_a6304_308:60-683(-)